MKKIILLIGRTGQGKSALANVLSGDNRTVLKMTREGKLEKSEEKELKESGSFKSETRSIQIVEFKHKFESGEEETYQIVDSIGIGDTSLTQSQVLREIAQGYSIIKEGIHQVLFVVSGRLAPEEIETYNMLKGFFFNENVDKYTTIIRTRFADFEEEDECKNDVELLLAEDNPTITKMINSCNGVTHVDNPSINIKGKRGERENPRNKEIREASRKILLEKLVIWKQICQENCKPKTPKKINKGFRGKVTEENDRLRREIEELKKKKISEWDKEVKKLEEKIKNNNDLEAIEALIEENKSLCQIL